MAEIRALVVDDEAAARCRLRDLLAQESDVHVVADAATAPEAVDAIRTHVPDLVFLDVQMPGGTGFDVVAALDEGPLPAIVFVTAYDEFAIRAFEAHAVDYLLKPFDDDRFATALAHARQRLREQTAGRLRDRLHHLLADTGGAKGGRTRIPVRQRDRIFLVDAEQVVWIEAAGDYVRLHLKTENCLARYRLSDLETELGPRFARVHRSAIVRLEAVQQLFPRTHGDYDLLLTNGQELRLSRSYRDRFSEALGVSL